MQNEVGQIVLQVCQSVPDGVLMFFPSYSLLDRLLTQWQVIFKLTWIVFCDNWGLVEPHLQDTVNQLVRNLSCDSWVSSKSRDSLWTVLLSCVSIITSYHTISCLCHAMSYHIIALPSSSPQNISWKKMLYYQGLLKKWYWRGNSQAFFFTCHARIQGLAISIVRLRSKNNHAALLAVSSRHALSHSLLTSILPALQFR